MGLRRDGHDLATKQQSLTIQHDSTLCVGKLGAREARGLAQGDAPSSCDVNSAPVWQLSP